MQEYTMSIEPVTIQEANNIKQFLNNQYKHLEIKLIPIIEDTTNDLIDEIQTNPNTKP